MSLRLVSFVALEPEDTTQAQNGGCVARLVEAELEESRARTAMLMAERQLAEDLGSLVRAQAGIEEAREDAVQAWAKLECAKAEALRADPEFKKLFVIEQLAEMKRNIARNEDQAKRSEHREVPKFQGRRPGGQGRQGSGVGGAERGGSVNQKSIHAGSDSSGFRNPVKNGETLLPHRPQQDAGAVPPTP